MTNENDRVDQTTRFIFLERIKMNNNSTEFPFAITNQLQNQILSLANSNISPYIMMITETVQEQEGTTPMYANSEADLAGQRIRYLKEQVYSIYETKRLELRKQFNIDDNSIKNANDLIDAIKNGQYILDDKEVARNWGATHGISFRDPTKPADRVGYDLAKLNLKDALQNTKNAIVVLSPEAGLEALNAFKAWKLS